MTATVTHEARETFYGELTDFIRQSGCDVGDASYFLVPLSDLKSDDSYQRTFSKSKAQTIEKHFDWRIIGLLIVSVREDGSLWLIDGRHRTQALVSRGFSHFIALKLKGLSVAEEARLFRYFNTFRANPKAIEIFTARLREGEPIASRISALCESRGWKIGKNASGPFTTKAVAALEAINKCMLLDVTLDFVGETWPKDSRNGDAVILQAVSALFRTTENGLKLRPELRESLSKIEIVALYSKAKSHVEISRMSMTTATRNVMVQLFNKGRRTKKLILNAIED